MNYFLQNPGTELEESYLKFVKLNLERFRAHLNDLENIPLFLIVVLLYLFSGLPAMRAIWCLRIFTAARIIHTISYLNAITVPRAASFLVGAACTVFVAGNVLYATIITGVF